MKLSQETVKVLKNFSFINSSIIFRPGSTLKTMHPKRSVMAFADVEDVFPGTAYIYDVNRFLSVLDLFEDPEIHFEETKFTIVEGKKKLNYFFAAPNMLIAPPEKEIKLPDAELTVKVSWNDFDSVLKSSNIFQFEQIAFTVENDSVVLKSINSNPGNNTSDSFVVDLEVPTERKFTAILSKEHLKLLTSDYEVQLLTKFAVFTGEKVKYIVALDTKSTFEA